MRSVSKFPDLLSEVTPYLTSPQPIAAMQNDGFTFGGEVGQALGRRKPAKPLEPAVLKQLGQTYGPPLPTRGTPALNNVGGIETISQTRTDNFTGTIISSTTTHSYILEGEPDFGVTITDANGMVRAARRLVALNVAGNRVGSKDNPVIVEVQRVVVSEPADAG
jgi:hypothetical protein